jgi:hypothetical protein
VILEVLEWKKDFKGKTFIHSVTATVDEAIGDNKELDGVMLNYIVKCLDTGANTTQQERRSLMNGKIDLKPSWSTLNSMRESLM